MAGFDRVHGDFQQVSNVDVGGYTVGAVNAPPATETTVNIAGPKLDFFTIVLANVATDGSVLKGAMDKIAQLATVHMYEVVDTTTDELHIAVYPVGAWTAGDLQDAIRNLGTVSGYDLSGATVTNNGFKLA